MVIYKITNMINDKVYVGQTVQSPMRRFRQHCRGRKSAISKAIRKYGEENFTMQILCITNTVADLNICEACWIAELQSLSPAGYNLVSGGTNKRASAETRERQRLAHLGKPAPWNSYKRSDEVKKAMSERQIGRPGYWTGKKRSRLLNSKPVLCVTNGVIYDSGRLAAEALGLQPSKISLVCAGIRPHTKGFVFRFKESA